MPLLHTQSEEADNVPLTTVAQGNASTAHDAATQASPRYDAATVQQIIALAQQMQTRHKETMTPEEVEALGHEVGVEPEFVRRALAQMESPTVGHTVVHTVVPTHQAVSALHPQAGLIKGWDIALPLATLYIFLAPLTFGGVDDYLNSAASKFLYLVLPLLLAFCVGRETRNHRTGAWVGGLLGLSAVVSLLIFTAFHQHRLPAFTEFAIVLMIWSSICAVLGGLGAIPWRKAAGR